MPLYRASLFTLPLIAAVLVPRHAGAADLDPMYADSPAIQQQQQLTFGSGWYVRGDIAATDGLGVSAGSVPYQNMTLGPGQTAPSLTTSTSDRPSYDAGIGAGYQFTPYFRADAVFDYDEPVSSSHSAPGEKCLTGDYGGGTAALPYEKLHTICTPTLTARLNVYDVLLNGYVDLGTWYGVTPFVGAGIGAAFGTATASSTYLQANGQPYDVTFTSSLNGQSYYQYWDRSQSQKFVNIAYAFMAGFGYAIYPHTTLEIGYRYVNLGSVLGTKIATQQARAGLRYMIDN